MKYVIFSTIAFAVDFEPNVTASRFFVIINKEDYTVEQILDEIHNSESITIMEDEEVVGIYNGYNNLVSVTITPRMGGNFTAEISLEKGSIEEQINSLTDSVSNLSAQMEELTPYTETKKAYYGEKEKTFYDVPEGNVSVYFDNYNGNYSINRIEDRVTVSFDALENETNVTISIR